MYSPPTHGMTIWPTFCRRVSEVSVRSTHCASVTVGGPAPERAPGPVAQPPASSASKVVVPSSLCIFWTPLLATVDGEIARARALLTLQFSFCFQDDVARCGTRDADSNLRRAG